MDRREVIVVGGISLSTAVSGCLNSIGREHRDKPWVKVGLLPDNIRVGVDSEQDLEIWLSQVNVMARRLPDENQEHHIKIDISSLEQYGVNIENLSVETTQGKFGPSHDVNTNVDAIDLTDGVIDLVILTSEDISETDPIVLKLVGFQFTDIEPVTEIEYDVQSPNDHVEVSDAGFSGADSNCRPRGSGDGRFKLIDPQLLPPTLCPQSITVDSTPQRLLIEWLTPEDDEIYIETDVSVLDEYGTAGTRINEREVRGAVLENATIDDSTISMKLVPDSDSNYAAVELRMEGIDITVTEPVDGLSYEMTVDGDVHETVETEPFDITEAFDDET